MIIFDGDDDGEFDWEEMAKAASRATGCDCEPNVTVEELEGPLPLRRVEVAHDPWCRLLKLRTAHLN